MDEKWKLIEDSNGYYYISNLGRMKREPHLIITSNGHKCNRAYKEYTPHFNKKNGYYSFKYNGGGFTCGEYVHRLVAKYFVNNLCPDIYNQVNHIDGDKSNNIYTNLEWCNEKKNMEHASKNGLINRNSVKRKKQAPINAKNGAHLQYVPLAEYDEQGNLYQIYEQTKNNGCFRLSYKKHYFRQADILKSLYGEVPQHINIERIKAIQDKKRKEYIATLPSGEIKTYEKLSDLPLAREHIWFAFNHNIADKNGVKWNIVNKKYSKYPMEFREEVVDALKTNTYKQVSAMYNIDIGTIIKWHKYFTTLNN